MGNIPCNGKFGGDRGGRDRRAHKCVSRTRTEYHDRYRAAAGNHGVIRPRAFPAIDASWPLVTLSSRACFPCTYIVTLPIPRYSLAKIQSPDFSVEKGPTLWLRNMIAPTHSCVQNKMKKYRGETNALFHRSEIKKKLYLVLFQHAPSLCIFFFLFLREQSLLFRSFEIFYNVKFKLQLQ